MKMTRMLSKSVKRGKTPLKQQLVSAELFKVLEEIKAACSDDAIKELKSKREELDPYAYTVGRIEAIAKMTIVTYKDGFNRE